MKPFYVYIVECCDGSLYVGHSDDLELRWAQHETRAFPQCYTFSRHPLKLAYVAEVPTRLEALERERQLKGWSRAKKRALINGDFGALHDLARCKSRPSTPRGPSDHAPLRMNGFS